MKYRPNRFEIVSFTTGFSLMVFELAAARVLAPTIGSSTYVWTSVIGIIIAALSVGYWLGGKIADNRKSELDVARLLLAVSITGLVSLMLYDGVLATIAGYQLDVRLQSVIAAVILFAPTSFLLGMTSPYLAKLHVTRLAISGSSIASLSALNSIGGIVGTFLTGFLLFGVIGVREIFALVVGVLLASSWVILPTTQWRHRACISAVVVLAAVLCVISPQKYQEIDTLTTHYRIQEGRYQDGRDVRLLMTRPRASQSGIYLDKPNELVFWHNQQFVEAVDRAPKKASILVLGGGALTLPAYLAEAYPKAIVDTVEIDDQLDDIARRYFAYKDHDNVNIIESDARTYLQQTNQQYDIVIVDAYGDLGIPFSMATKEYGDDLAGVVHQDSVVLANIITNDGAGCGEYYSAITNPYRQHFQYGRFLKQERGGIAYNTVASFTNRADYQWGNPLTASTNRLLTDNFAPIEQLQYRCMNG